MQMSRRRVLFSRPLVLFIICVTQDSCLVLCSIWGLKSASSRLFSRTSILPSLRLVLFIYSLRDVERRPVLCSFKLLFIYANNFNSAQTNLSGPRYGYRRHWLFYVGESTTNINTPTSGSLRSIIMATRLPARFRWGLVTSFTTFN